MNFKVVQFELCFSLLILAVLLTQKGRGNIEQSTGKWRWISTISLVLVDLSFHQTHFYSSYASLQCWKFIFLYKFKVIAVCLWAIWSRTSAATVLRVLVIISELLNELMLGGLIRREKVYSPLPLVTTFFSFF